MERNKLLYLDFDKLHYFFSDFKPYHYSRVIEFWGTPRHTPFFLTSGRRISFALKLIK